MGIENMFELLARLFRVLWRQDNDGTGGSAVVLAFPVESAEVSPTVSAPVAFIRQLGGSVPGSSATPARRSRPLSAQLQGVSRLNPPVSRARSKTASAGKPKPMAAVPAHKRISAKPGVVLNRIQGATQRRSAAVVDLAEIRAEVRRAKQIEATDMELVALFN